MRLSKVVYIAAFIIKLKEIRNDLPNFNTFSLVLLFYIFKRLEKCIFRLGEVRSGSKGFSHYILYCKKLAAGITNASGASRRPINRDIRV